MAEEQAPPSERGPNHTGWAARALRLLDTHPQIKLLTVLWVVAWSVWAPIDSCRKERRAEELAGLVYTPEVKISASGQGCALINAGNRTVLEATLVWNTYSVVLEPCAPGAHTWMSHVRPAAETRELRPRDILRAERTTEQNENDLRTHVALGIQAGRDHLVFVECEARYHRQADLARYVVRDLALLDAESRQLRPIRGLYQKHYSATTGVTLKWKEGRKVQARGRVRSRTSSNP